MKKGERVFGVTVRRIVREDIFITVTASDLVKAEAKALNEASSHTEGWDCYDCKYFVD